VKGAEILANAVALEPLLREQAAENERLRRLNPTTAAALRSAGAFRLPMPAAWGGPEIDIVTQTEIVETLSRADGSAGWCAMIGSDGGFYSAFLAALARAEAMVGSVRSYTYDNLGSFWATLEAGETPTMEQRAALAGSFAYTFQTCREAVALLYEEVGSQSVYRTCPLDRHLRDLVTIGQHIMGQTRMLEMAGGLWLGQPSPLPVL